MEMTEEVPAAFHASAARPGPVGMVAEAIREIRSRRHLIGYLAHAELRKKGTDTLFGNLWWILDPLLQMAVYVVLVTIIFQRKMEAYPLFIFAAILPWKWFTTAINDAISSVTGQGVLIKQIQFPKIVLPAADMLGGILQFLFGLIPLAGLLLILYPGRISWTLVFIPAVALVQFVFTIGLGLILAALNVFFRDMGNLARHLLRLWFYLSPALYGADTVTKLGESHPTVVQFMRINPFYTILESYRNAIYYGRIPDFGALAIVLGVSLVLLVVATMFFKRLEPAFAKVL
jgi:ABC-type polysaccharide/polyol phosphate export permease